MSLHYETKGARVFVFPVENECAERIRTACRNIENAKDDDMRFSEYLMLLTLLGFYRDETGIAISADELVNVSIDG